MLERPHLPGDALMPRAIGFFVEKSAMSLELLCPSGGTQRALLLVMQDIETLNVEQIATVTDLLLLRARHTNRRFSANKQLFAADHKRPSYREIAPIPSLVDGSVGRVRQTAPTDVPELTLFVRAKRFSTSTASAALLATLFAIAIALTSVV